MRGFHRKERQKLREAQKSASSSTSQTSRGSAAEDSFLQAFKEAKWQLNKGWKAKRALCHPGIDYFNLKNTLCGVFYGVLFHYFTDILFILYSVPIWAVTFCLLNKLFEEDHQSSVTFQPIPRETQITGGGGFCMKTVTTLISVSHMQIYVLPLSGSSFFSAWLKCVQQNCSSADWKLFISWKCLGAAVGEENLRQT